MVTCGSGGASFVAAERLSGFFGPGISESYTVNKEKKIKTERDGNRRIGKDGMRRKVKRWIIVGLMIEIP